jgi:cytoskeleton protein RodZ
MSSRKRQLNTDPPSLNPPAKDMTTVPPLVVTSEVSVRESGMRTPPERVGEMLRRVRQERRDDLKQIADYLCIKRSFLQAIEESHYDELPADAYVIGFLRSYASYLGFDDKEVLDHFRREMEGRRKKPALILPTPISEGRTPSGLIMVGAAIAALFIYILWYEFSGPSHTEISPPPLPTAEVVPSDKGATTIIPPPTAVSSTPLISKPSTPPTAELLSLPQPAASPLPIYGDSKTASQIIIKAQQSSWILVSDPKGHTVFDRVLKPGESYKVPDMEGLVLTTGNGGGITVSLQGVDLPKLADGASHVLRNVPLDAEHLKTLSQSPKE